MPTYFIDCDYQFSSDEQTSDSWANVVIQGNLEELDTQNWSEFLVLIEQEILARIASEGLGDPIRVQNIRVRAINKL